MELNEQLDQKYNNDKKAYQKTQRLSQTIKDLEQQLKMLKREWEDAKIKQIRAKEDGETSLEKEAQAEIETKVEEAKKVQARLDTIKEVIEKNKSKVDGYIEELKKEPGFEEHVNSILEKRYNRQLAKALKEEQQVNTILDLCQKHPTLANNLRGMVRAQEELDKLNKEIEPLDPEKDKDKLDKIQSKIEELVGKKNSNMDTFMAYCAKKDVNVDREFLDRLISEKGFAHDKQGNINVEKTLKNMSKGYKKRILAYQVAIGRIPNAKLSNINEKELGSGDSDNTQPIPPTNNGEHTNNGDPKPPVPKFKWYEFRKRFNAWRERRKAEKEKGNDSDLDPDTSTGNSASEKFRNSYKYDVVKDYVDKTEKEIYKESLKEVKQALKDDNQQTVDDNEKTMVLRSDKDEER